MKILVDIIHPAHVHFFRNAIRIWREKHDVLVTSRKKEITLQLLDTYGIKNRCLSIQQSGLTGLFRELITRDFNLYKVARKFKPDVLTGIAGVSIAHVGKLVRKPSIVFYDTEIATLSNAITYPLASVICTPACYMGNIGKKQIRYSGYHELAYLYPRWFKPNREILNEAGVNNKKFFILRFVSWQASHDISKKGISLEAKLGIIKMLNQYGRIFISSEAELPPVLHPYRLSISPEKMHHLMAFATLVIGEGATVASEAAMLGTPALYITRPGRGLGYTNELETRYGLIFSFGVQQQTLVMQKIEALLQKTDLREEWQTKREKMLKDKIDVTEFIKKFVEMYPINPVKAKKLSEILPPHGKFR